MDAQPENHTNDHEDPKPEFDDIASKFDIKTISKLKRLKSPGKNIRNILIVFLTLLHEELMDLINDSEEDIDQPVEEEDEVQDREWTTIKCFFKSETQTVALIHSLRGLIKNRRISEEYYKKGAAIFESFVTAAEEHPTQEEEEVCSAFTELVQFIYELELVESGIDYLKFNAEKAAVEGEEEHIAQQKRKQTLEVIYEIENSEFSETPNLTRRNSSIAGARKAALEADYPLYEQDVLVSEDLKFDDISPVEKVIVEDLDEVPKIFEGDMKKKVDNIQNVQSSTNSASDVTKKQSLLVDSTGSSQALPNKKETGERGDSQSQEQSSSPKEDKIHTKSAQPRKGIQSVETSGQIGSPKQESSTNKNIEPKQSQSTTNKSAKVKQVEEQKSLTSSTNQNLTESSNFQKKSHVSASTVTNNIVGSPKEQPSSKNMKQSLASSTAQSKTGNSIDTFGKQSVEQSKPQVAVHQASVKPDSKKSQPTPALIEPSSTSSKKSKYTTVQDTNTQPTPSKVQSTSNQPSSNPTATKRLFTDSSNQDLISVSSNIASSSDGHSSSSRVRVKRSHLNQLKEQIVCERSGMLKELNSRFFD